MPLSKNKQNKKKKAAEGAEAEAATFNHFCEKFQSEIRVFCVVSTHAEIYFPHEIKCLFQLRLYTWITDAIFVTLLCYIWNNLMY